MESLGIEINPLARLIAKVKTTPIDKHSVLDAWSRIQARYGADRSRAGLPDFPNKRHWFTELVEKRLARILRSLDALRDTDLRDFFLVAASSVVRQVALADPKVSVPVILNPNNFKDSEVKKAVRADLAFRREADAFYLMRNAVDANLRRLTYWSRVSRKSASIVGMDARTFVQANYAGAGRMHSATGRRISNVDLVLTSPPYVNAQRYTRSLRLELFALGFTGNGSDEVELDRQLVGTERVHMRDFESYFQSSGSRIADGVIASIRKVDPYRAAIVGKYVRDMKKVVWNCFDAIKPGGHAVMVLGNNSVRGVNVDNAAILNELSLVAGLEEKVRLRNRIPSRGLLTKRHHTAGVITHEHVLVMRKPSHSR
jgi:hypothetical protein